MPTVTPVFGMQGTGRWDSDERPENWRQELLRNYPRGSTPLTAIMSKAAKEVVGDPIFHWWEKDLITNAGAIGVQSGDLTNIFTNQAMTTQYETTYGSWNAAAGTVLHIKIDATASDPVTNYVRVGSTVVLAQAADYRTCVRAEVISVDRGAGASSRITVKTITADSGVDASSVGHADRMLVLPTFFPEFGGVPEVLSYKPGSFYNYTSIKKEALAMSRTAMSVRNLRPDSNDWKEAKREALENLGIQMEWEILYGARSESTDPLTNQLKRQSMGIRQYIETYGLAANFVSYKRDSSYSGSTWLQGGFDWLMNTFMNISLYANLEKTYHIVGNGVKLALSALAEHRAHVNIVPMDVEYGMKINKLITPFGEFNVVDAPLMNREPTLQYSWIGVPFNSLRYRTVSDEMYGNSDVRFLPDPNYGKGGINHVDGRFDLWLVECGYEFHRSKEWFMLSDVGKDNIV